MEDALGGSVWVVEGAGLVPGVLAWVFVAVGAALDVGVLVESGDGAGVIEKIGRGVKVGFAVDDGLLVAVKVGELVAVIEGDSVRLGEAVLEEVAEIVEV